MASLTRTSSPRTASSPAREVRSRDDQQVFPPLWFQKPFLSFCKGLDKLPQTAFHSLDCVQLDKQYSTAISFWTSLRVYCSTQNHRKQRQGFEHISPILVLSWIPRSPTHRAESHVDNLTALIFRLGRASAQTSAKVGAPTHSRRSSDINNFAKTRL